MWLVWDYDDVYELSSPPIPLALSLSMEVADHLVEGFRSVGLKNTVRVYKEIPVYNTISAWEAEYKEALIATAKAKLTDKELTALGLRR